MSSFEEAIEPLLDCMCTALAQAGWQGQCCLNPGQPVIDSCCEDEGTAWGRLIRAYPSSNFPREDQGTSASLCLGTSQWALVVELGAVMCVCDDMCDCSKKSENASAVLAISEAGLQGVLCCLSDGPCSDREHRVESLTIGGPEGNCAGFKIQLTVQHFMNCCPPTNQES